MIDIKDGDLVYYPSNAISNHKAIGEIFKVGIDGFTGDYYIFDVKNIRSHVKNINLLYPVNQQNKRLLELLHPDSTFADVAMYNNIFLDKALSDGRVVLCESRDCSLVIITHKDDHGKYIDRDGDEWENLIPVHLGRKNLYYEAYSDDGKRITTKDVWNLEDGYIER